jgi:malate dehydrogenase
LLQAKVAVLGAAGGIGQPLSLLLKNSNLIGDLSLYDVANTAGVACDLSHISTACKVKGYSGAGQLHDALRGCQLVVIPAGAEHHVQFEGSRSACATSSSCTGLQVAAVAQNAPWQLLRMPALGICIM